MLQAMKNAVARKKNNVERQVMPGGAARKYAIIAIINRAKILARVRMYLGP
jgi:hypothetical protein